MAGTGEVICSPKPGHPPKKVWKATSDPCPAPEGKQPSPEPSFLSFCCSLPAPASPKHSAFGAAQSSPLPGPHIADNASQSSCFLLWILFLNVICVPRSVLRAGEFCSPPSSDSAARAPGLSEPPDFQSLHPWPVTMAASWAFRTESPRSGQWHNHHLLPSLPVTQGLLPGPWQPLPAWQCVFEAGTKPDLWDGLSIWAFAHPPSQ